MDDHDLAYYLSDENLCEQGLSLNQVSQMSGIAYSYLHGIIKKGGVTKPGRKNLISIAIGLNLSFEQINALLKRYGHAPERISFDDIDIFKTCAKKRKIVGTQPIFNDLNYHLIFLGLETLPGDLIVVMKSPPSVLKDENYLQFSGENSGITDPVYHQLISSVQNERKWLLDNLLKTNKLHLLVCFRCFEKYVKRAIERKEYRTHIKNHLCELLKYIKHPNYHFELIEDHSYQQFEMKLAPDGSKMKDKVLMVGYGANIHKGITEDNSTDRLMGFATDSEKITNHLYLEYKQLRSNYFEQSKVEQDKLRRKTCNYISSIVEKL